MAPTKKRPPYPRGCDGADKPEQNLVHHCFASERRRHWAQTEDALAGIWSPFWERPNRAPLGTRFDAPVLTDEQAYDVAGYIVSPNRPEKANLERDFPIRLQKPIDAPYGPYADGFPAEQHKFGPFGPIRAKVKELAAESRTASAGDAMFAPSGGREVRVTCIPTSAARQLRGRSRRARSSPSGCGASACLCIPVRTSRRHRPASPRSCKGSRKLGWAVGRNMRIDYRWSEAMPRACANMRQNWSRSVRRSPARRAALPIDLAMNARLQGQNV